MDWDTGTDDTSFLKPPLEDPDEGPCLAPYQASCEIFSPQKKLTRMTVGSTQQLRKQSRQRCKKNSKKLKQVDSTKLLNARANFEDIRANATDYYAINSDHQALADAMHAVDPISTSNSIELEDYDGTAEYSTYVDLILEGTGGFVQLERNLFVVQGWDEQRLHLKVKY